MKIETTQTLEPFKTENGTLVRSSGVSKMPNTEKWDKLKNTFVYNWCVEIIHLATGKYQYWIFDYYGNRIKVLKNNPIM